MILKRRTFIGGAASTAALLVLMPIPVSATTLNPDVAAALDDILDGRTAEDAGIDIDAPTVAENGAQVPLTIRVDSPMTAEDHVTAIHILATLKAAGDRQLSPDPAPDAGRGLYPHPAGRGAGVSGSGRTVGRPRFAGRSAHQRIAWRLRNMRSAQPEGSAT